MTYKIYQSLITCIFHCHFIIFENIKFIIIYIKILTEVKNWIYFNTECFEKNEGYFSRRVISIKINELLWYAWKIIAWLYSQLRTHPAITFQYSLQFPDCSMILVIANFSNKKICKFILSVYFNKIHSLKLNRPYELKLMQNMDTLRDTGEKSDLWNFILSWV